MRFLLILLSLTHFWGSARSEASVEPNFRTAYCGQVSGYQYYRSTSSDAGDAVLLTFERASTVGYWREATQQTTNGFTAGQVKIVTRPGLPSDRSLLLMLNVKVREATHRENYRLCISYPSELAATPDTAPIPVYLLSSAIGPALKNPISNQFDDSLILRNLHDGL